MYYLAAYYNMSVFHFKYPRTLKVPRGRSFQLEVNPNYVFREQSDTLNTIDARWIDMETGLFIDLTAARYNLTHPHGKGILSCKDGHEYRVSSRLRVSASRSVELTLQGYLYIPPARNYV